MIKKWSSKTCRKTYRIASETSPWNSSSPTSSSLFPSKTLQTLQTFPSLAEPRQCMIQFCRNINWHPLFEWSDHWGKRTVVQGVPISVNPICSWATVFYSFVAFFVSSLAMIPTLNFSFCRNVSLTWETLIESVVRTIVNFFPFLCLQRNGRVALTYTIWTWARLSKAPAPIFLTHILLNF